MTLFIYNIGENLCAAKVHKKSIPLETIQQKKVKMEE
jgi:hypothetical protein